MTGHGAPRSTAFRVEAREPSQWPRHASTMRSADSAPAARIVSCAGSPCATSRRTGMPASGQWQASRCRNSARPGGPLVLHLIQVRWRRDRAGFQGACVSRHLQHDELGPSLARQVGGRSQRAADRRAAVMRRQHPPEGPVAGRQGRIDQHHWAGASADHRQRGVADDPGGLDVRRVGAHDDQRGAAVRGRRQDRLGGISGAHLQRGAARSAGCSPSVSADSSPPRLPRSRAGDGRRLLQLGQAPGDGQRAERALRSIQRDQHNRPGHCAISCAGAGGAWPRC